MVSSRKEEELLYCSHDGGLDRKQRKGEGNWRQFLQEIVESDHYTGPQVGFIFYYK